MCNDGHVSNVGGAIHQRPDLVDLKTWSALDRQVQGKAWQQGMTYGEVDHVCGGGRGIGLGVAGGALCERCA